MAGIGSLLKSSTKVARRIGDEFDPRFDPRKKEQERLQNLEVVVEPRQLDRPQVSIADFEGYPFVTSMSDRTAAGGMLTDIRGVPLSEPVNLRGGQDFMFDYNPGQVWASGKAQASDIFSVAQRARHKTGQDPIFLPWRMAPTGGDFATMTGETMLSFARDSMNKKTKRSLDSKLKKIIPNWPGVDNPDAIDVFRAAPDKARKAAKNVMDVEFRDRGGLSIGEARLAVADPAQLDAQQGGVQNVGRILTDREVNFSTHPTYPMAVPGEGVGVLKEDINVFELLPDIVEARNIPDPLSPRDTDLRSMQMGAKAGRITPELLRKILGGGAGAAVGIEALLQEEAPPMAVGMAVGGMVSSAAAKAIRRLVEAGFPESTAEKIVMGDLPMDRASVNRRRVGQGKTMPTIHTGDARAAQAPFFDPDINAAAGTFSTDNPYLANTYYNPGGSSDRMAMYPLFLDDSDYALVNANIGSDWMEMSGDIMTPDASDVIESFSDLNTNEVARRVRELGYPGVRMEGVQDIGPAGADAAYDAAYQIGLREGGGDPDYAEEFARSIVTDVERGLGEGQGMIFASFDPTTVRSRFAAFDPDQVGSPNLLAGLAPYAVPTVLGGSILGAAMTPEEAEAAGFGTLARAIGRPTQRLFQGSSAKFARPSLQSVGTGTGNQAFGYGLYFTEAPDIAGTYKRGLANKKMIQSIEDQGLVPGVSAGELDDMIEEGVFGEAETRFLRALQDTDYLGFDNAHNAAMVALKRGDLAKRYDAANDPAVAELDKIANELGFLYEVEVPEGSFIEWDLPLSEQPELVQQVVKESAPPELRKRIESGQLKGLEAYFMFGKNPEVNSAMWAQYGVPGIRYSAVRTKEGKRAPDSPRNYVIFDENLINVVRRNDEALENNFDELAARAAATDVRRPMAAILGAGAASTQAGQEDVPDYMRRLDGSIKSERGFLGPIQNNVSGRTMTEVSVGQPGSEEGFYPLLVPTLTRDEIDTVANMDLGRERPPQAIIEKARAHAMDRMARGMSPFYQDDEPFDFRDASARSLAQEDVFGGYDQRAVAITSQALDRLQREAQIREASIGPREALEAAATIGSSILGSVPAGLEGLFTLARTGDREAAEARINEIQEALTYMPSSQGSIDALQAAAGPLEALAAPSEFMGQQTLDITGSPFLATAAELFLDPLNLLTFGGLGAALKRAGRAQ